MKEKFYKNEASNVILLIVIYVVLNSYCINSFGTTSYITTIINMLISVFLIILIKVLDRTKYYGFTKVKNLKRYLYFLPLLVIGTVNIWNGFNINNSLKEIIFYILTMVNVGFIEEIIFRGFLFKMLEKDNLNKAIIISSLTFGIGHIVNLLNGEDLIPTLFQICYAISLGYLFVTIFIKSKSLIPCIITHSLINSLAIFNVENTLSAYLVPAILIVISLSYSFYIKRSV